MAPKSRHSLIVSELGGRADDVSPSVYPSVCRSPCSAEPAGKKDDKPTVKELFDGKTLKGWKAADFVHAGKLHVKDGNLVMDKGNRMTGCVYTGKDFPKIDYEVTLEGKKVEGDDFFCTTTFPVGESFCSLVVGGWGGGVVGISSINGADASENETHQSRQLQGRPLVQGPHPRDDAEGRGVDR